MLIDQFTADNTKKKMKALTVRNFKRGKTSFVYLRKSIILKKKTFYSSIVSVVMKKMEDSLGNAF